MVKDHMKRPHRQASRSLLLLAIRYTEQGDNGLFCCQWAASTDLRDRLPTKIIKVALGITDPAVALKKVKLLNAKHERQWISSRLTRSPPQRPPKSPWSTALPPNDAALEPVLTMP